MQETEEQNPKKGMPQLTKGQYVVIIILSGLLAPYVMSATSSFFPPMATLLITSFVVIMCVHTSFQRKNIRIHKTWPQKTSFLSQQTA
jgi:uncharacterized membrane protein YcaP (DUF421 family)